MNTTESIKLTTAIRNFSSAYISLVKIFNENEEGLNIALNENELALDMYEDIFKGSFDDLRIDELCKRMLLPLEA